MALRHAAVPLLACVALRDDLVPVAALACVALRVSHRVALRHAAVPLRVSHRVALLACADAALVLKHFVRALHQTVLAEVLGLRV